MRRIAFALLAGVIATPVAAQEHRELGAHEHGRGTFNMAIEGSKVTMELEVPGADIVGFEHAAKSRRDKAAVEKAKVQLMAPLALFRLPAPADCRVTEANVEVEQGEHDHGKEAHADAKGEGHSEFHAQYALECGSVSSVTSIEFAYFGVFAGAQKLEVNVVTPKGQSKFEATRAKPSISLVGMM